MPTSSPWSRASIASSTTATTARSSRRVVERLIPLAESRLVIENEFVPDLPQELWQGDEHTAVDHRAGHADG